MSENLHSTNTFADIFSAGNPFSENDPRYGFWETNAACALEAIERLRAKLLKRLPEEGAKTEEWLSLFLDSVAGVFDIYAHTFLVFTVWGPDSALSYMKSLDVIAEHLFVKTCQKRPSFIPEPLLSSELRIRLSQRKAHYRAEALRLSRECRESAGVSEQPSTRQVQVTEAAQGSAFERTSTGSASKSKLVPKKQDLSRYLDSAELTERQRECVHFVGNMA